MFGNVQGKSSQKASTLQKPPADSVKALPHAQTVPKAVKEEWPSLSEVANHRKKCVDLPLQTSPTSLSAELRPLSTAGLSAITETASCSPLPAETSTGLGMTGLGAPPKTKPALSAVPSEIASKLKPKPVEEKIHAQTERERHGAKLEPSSTPLVDTTRDTACVSNVSKDEIVDRRGTTSNGREMPSQKALTAAAVRPITPSVRLSPAPSGDPRMTIVVESLSKDEPEEDVKSRFRAYGRLVNMSFRALYS